MHSDADIREFFRGKFFRFSGWGRFSDGSLPQFRKTISDFGFSRYPASFGGETKADRVEVLSSAGLEINGGDSGNPLYLEDSGVSKAVAIAQGEGRHVPTFYRGGRDSTLDRPNIALWIDEIIGREDCIRIDTSRASIEQASGKWNIVHGNRKIYGDLGNERKAKRSLEILQYYQIDEVCYVNRPVGRVNYILIGSSIPLKPMQGEDCIPNMPGQMRIVNEDDGWLLTDGRTRKFFFEPYNGSSVSAFNEAHYVRWIMKKHAAKFVCYVGRPESSFMYFRR